MVTPEDSILSLLQRPVSKSEATFVANMFIDHPDKIPELIDYIKFNDLKITMRASWILGTLWEIEPQLLRNHQYTLVQIVLSTESDSVRRNLLRIIETMPLPDEFLGSLFDICLKWTKSEQFAIAVRAFSMQVLYRICCLEPDLTSEVMEQINLITEFGSPGLKHRSKKLLIDLSKIKKKIE